MAIDIEAMANEMIFNLGEELSDGWDKISAFQQNQASLIAKQAALIAQLKVMGNVADDETIEFLTEQLKDKVENFAKVIANLSALTLEKAWNAAVGVFWNAINKALTGAGLVALPIPDFQADNT